MNRCIIHSADPPMAPHPFLFHLFQALPWVGLLTAGVLGGIPSARRSRLGLDPEVLLADLQSRAEGTGDGLLLVDAEHWVLAANRQAEAAFGEGPAGLQGRSAPALLRARITWPPGVAPGAGLPLGSWGPGFSRPGRDGAPVPVAVTVQELALPGGAWFLVRLREPRA